ncbi:MAG: GNAT family N-acetyltransferase [Anaerolineae bacterium]|nr:GNAT family N-acetyltransferase [Anaerolineae bacterium]
MNRKFLDELKQTYPDKFAPENRIFKNIRRGDRIFISTACGEPQYLVQALINYVESHPSAFFDTEVFHVWSLGLAPYADVKFKDHFRYNSFFVGDSTRSAVNEGLADYSPIFLSQIPNLFYRRLVPIDVALIQTSLPDAHGYLSLGISVDITKAAVECANRVIIQINANMPRTHGDSYIHIKDVDFAIAHDEPILEFKAKAESDEVAQEIGRYVARLIQDGDTIQVGYGSIPNAIMDNLYDKKHLGVHTELLSNGLVKLIKAGVVDNSRKTVNRGQTIATFCMGSRETYEFLHDNPAVKFRRVDYTNDPLLIAQQYNMTAINSGLEVDLTGQASAESIGSVFYSGIGGQADFMRGAILAPGGKTILTLPSTADNGNVSRISPFLKEGAGVTLNRGDIHYIVTEYGIAYLHGKNIRERAMELIAIAHPKFRPKLIQEAKQLNLIYQDQAFIPGKRGKYPEELETYRTTKGGVEVFMRPVKISDEPRLKEFFYALSDKSLYRRFMSVFKSMPHERLQEFVVIDYTTDMVILGIMQEDEKETIVGVGQYGIHEQSHTAEAAFAVRDDYQGLGIGRELVSYLTYLAQRQGLLGFTAEVLQENRHMLYLFESAGFDLEKRTEEGVYHLKMAFRGT